MDNTLIQAIPQIIISPQGIFKYILIQIFINQQLVGQIVRGDKKHQYHADNFKAFKQQLTKYGFENVVKKGDQITGVKNNKTIIFKCPGGGRIQHNYNNKKCSIYGYSKTYGNVNHEIARDIVMRNLKYTKQQIKLNEKDY